MVEGVGVVGEAACGACHARFLDHVIAERVRETYLRIEPALFVELAHSGAPSAPCPRCGTRMRVQQVRGTQVDLCTGCGGMLLDAGELLRLSLGALPEVAAPAPTGGPIADRPAQPPVTRWGVTCLQCDAQLDLSTAHYLVNDRPWCADCVAAHGLAGWRSVLSLLGSSLGAGIVFPLSFMGLRGRPRLGRIAPDPVHTAPQGLDALKSMWNTVVERVEPTSAEQRFAPFLRRL